MNVPQINCYSPSFEMNLNLDTKLGRIGNKPMITDRQVILLQKIAKKRGGNAELNLTIGSLFESFDGGGSKYSYKIFGSLIKNGVYGSLNEGDFVTSWQKTKSKFIPKESSPFAIIKNYLKSNFELTSKMRKSQ